MDIQQTTLTSNTSHTQCQTKTKRSTWTNQALKEAMEAIEARTHFQRKTNKSWGIPFTSVFDHLNGKTRSQKWDQ
jgi:hypothetical protein